MRNATVIGVLLFSVFVSPARGAITSAERSQLTRIKNAINAAARSYKQDKFRDCGIELQKAHKLIEKVAAQADAELLKAIEPSFRRLKRAHQLVREKGESIPAIRPLPTPAQAQAAREKAKAAAKEKAAARARAAEESASEETTEDGETIDSDPVDDTDPVDKVNERETPRDLETMEATQQETRSSDVVSFTKQVAPILVGRCGRCHVGDSKGDFEMPTYAALMKGSENGPVIVAEKPDDSTLIQLVEGGDMPPKGGPIPAKDIKLLKDWVAQGAKFDGQSRTAKLTSFVSAESRPNSGQDNREPRRPRRPQ